MYKNYYYYYYYHQLHLAISEHVSAAAVAGDGCLGVRVGAGGLVHLSLPEQICFIDCNTLLLVRCAQKNCYLITTKPLKNPD